ncbi:primosomal protein N' [Candidatus Parcubacteria bacterium]|nr:primosomal protein N' [Candidatus Parcubacteria bacterium]
MSNPKQFVLVSPLDYGALDRFALTYATATEVQPGAIVEVPLVSKTGLGVVTGPAPQPQFATKALLRVLDLPALPPHLVELAEWLHHYYLASPKSVWQTMLPAGLLQRRRPPRRAAVPPFQLKPLDHPLTVEQQAAIAAIKAGRHHSYLLQGVTGSGKTQVYIELAKEALAAGRSVIVMVPEIALAPQLGAQFRAVFGDQVIASHSRLTPAQRHRAWTAAQADGAKVIIGPRSSLFLPLSRLGLIVVDEAHETSYKQEQSPRYHAVTAAAKLAALAGSKLVLGSATPGLGELYLTERGRIGLVKLTQRANLAAPPAATIVDLRDRSQTGRNRFISRPLAEALETTLAAGRQSLLFLNRRGSASSHICTDCGRAETCPHCQLALTFHADLLRLVCHICNHRAAPAAVCPPADGGCGSSALRYVGGGTKRIEDEVRRLLPAARLARLDKDSATPRYLDEVYRGLHDGQIDVLIGTQMIAKGLDLSRLDLVGIILADSMLHLPDYTAAERTFQLIAQVSGRAGRGDRAGRVIIQSYTPDHPAIVAGAEGTFERFAAAELTSRAALDYPPHAHLLKLTCAAPSQDKAIAAASRLADQLRQTGGLKLLGPAPAFRERSAGRHHWQIVVKAKRRSRLLAAAKLAPSGWTVDLDPVNLL